MLTPSSTVPGLEVVVLLTVVFRNGALQLDEVAVVSVLIELVVARKELDEVVVEIELV